MKEYLENVRCVAPLIHNITNYVTANDVANVLLACGASPIMADEEAEVEEITAHCMGLNLNLGTLNQKKIPAMQKAGKMANKLGHVVVLDPVGVGASSFRKQTAEQLLKEVRFDAIRGNISEIKTLASLCGTQEKNSGNMAVSDTMDVVGSYTGIIGLDGLSLAGNEYSADRYLSEMQGLDDVYETVAARINQASTQIEKNVIAAAALTNYNIRNGAIATLSLHMPNFSTVSETGNDTGVSYAGYNFSGYTPNLLTGDVMNQILPGGAYNEAFRAYLDMVADYAHQVDGAVLFRPFHENTGSWFWWGAAFCDEQTYKSVYKYTVEYLRDEKNVHNFLYVYGPGSEAASVEEYASRYPGDGYVDMVGFDMYHRNPQQGDSFVTNFTKELQIVDDFAQAHGKLVAVTETGTAHDVAEGDNQTALLKSENTRPDWHQEILDAVKGSNASYYLVWANFGEKDGFYTPYVKSVKEDGAKHGHEMMDPFIRFFNIAPPGLCTLFEAPTTTILSGRSNWVVIISYTGFRLN